MFIAHTHTRTHAYMPRYKSWTYTPQIHSHLWDSLLFLLRGLRFLKYTHLKQAFKSEEVNATVTSPPTHITQYTVRVSA